MFHFQELKAREFLLQEIKDDIYLIKLFTEFYLF